MLQLFRRRRGHDNELDPLAAEIARERLHTEHLPTPGRPVPARRPLTVLRHKAAIITTAAVVAGCGLWAGGAWFGAEMQDWRADARIEAEERRADAEIDALVDAYTAAYHEELRDRGYSQEKIDRARGVVSITGGDELPAPKERDTLEIRRQFHEAWGRSAALLEAQNAD